ncbi:MAG: VWA domain-containing protein [Deltaproteobacteria bacterium]|nr:VWA domain-containing protein [Deltaproteobacteria bacterium]
MTRNRQAGISILATLIMATLMLATTAWGAGTLTPVGSPDAPIEIRDHHAKIVINNGFAQTEVTQTFYNPNPTELEGIYAFPVPRSASLSEVTIRLGERELQGEVVPKDEAERIYQEERSQGREAGLASKQGYQTFEFRVSPIPARGETQLRFVYYQPLEIDTGVGRYLYPLEDGGTDELAKSFWVPNTEVKGNFSVDLELKSAWPIADLRVPGFENEAVVEKLGEGHHRVRVERQSAQLDRDFLVYYRLQEGLPGRVELLPFRDDPSKPGSFMLVVTPGLDLGLISGGADYVFVLDVSGSMAGKIGALAQGVSKGLGELDPADRFRIVTFDGKARELTRGWTPATPEAVTRFSEEVQTLATGSSTNLYAGLKKAFAGLDADRATSVILVTDAVTNTGVVEPRKFRELMQQYDVRVFGFLMGNSGNWPLMRLISESSGGFYAGISNADDVIGQILLAKSKVTHEALHDAEFEIRGVKTFDTTGRIVGKIYRGQQLVLFGRYEGSGPASLELRAKLTGEDKTYRTEFDFPELDTQNPELERLWAMSRIEEIETMADAGFTPADESKDAIRDLGVAYQLVTDETSMLVLGDESFARHGIERRNRERVAREHTAQAQRSQQPAQNRRVDRNKPMFDLPTPSVGGGAIDPVSGGLVLGLAGLALGARRRRARNGGQRW